MAMQFDALATGNSGHDTFGNEAEADAKQEAIAEQQAAIRDLMPDVEFLRGYVDNEITAISDIRSYIKELGAKPSKAQIEAEYRARELYITFLQRFKGDVDNQVGLAENEAAR